MNLLLHICCGPCAIYPLSILKKQGIAVHGYFYNPNIHPYREFSRRIQGVRELAETIGVEVEIDSNYGLTEYLQKVVFHEQERCLICYAMRLEAIAQKASEKKYDAFSTTLLYSKYQNHVAIIKTGETLARKYQIGFHYQDFRTGWQQGIDQAISMNLYRQPYCGCIYSEQERYDKALRKKCLTPTKGTK
jgi:predicted adenine nucleotide alpha hydrolase (AANH) superfamily ATPase